MVVAIRMGTTDAAVARSHGMAPLLADATADLTLSIGPCLYFASECFLWN